MAAVYFEQVPTLMIVINLSAILTLCSNFSDEDPPHLRQVLVIQANEIKFSFPLDNIKRPPFPSVFDTSSGLKDQLGSSSQGVTVTIKSVVHW